MLRKVVVTGIGIISAIGKNAEETIVSISNLKTGINRLTLFDSVHNDIPVGEIKLTTDELFQLSGIPASKEIYTRTTLLGLIAAQQAMLNAGISKFGDDRTGVISATSVGGMDLNEKYYKSLLVEDTYKQYLEVFDSSDSTEKIAGFFGVRHHVTTISTACSSSANSIMTGARLIRNNQLDRVLVGGTDALTKFTLNGFFALEILSPTGCRPFDQNRNGLTIGEGAAFLLLEAEDVADKEKVICQITGYANTNEAFHQTASSSDGSGAFMAMEKALSVGGLKPSQIDYINAHGTGTVINDLSEGCAIERLFSASAPKFSSTKAFTGHTLGAAGAIEAVLSVLCIKNQMVLPNLNFTTPIEGLSLVPQTKPEKAVVNHVMSNSLGFGGSNTSLIFSKS
jgi:3-oxoacyl-[acyl-carrier-protein] synthase-1